MPGHETLFDDIDSMDPGRYARHLSNDVVMLYRSSGDLIDDYRIFIDLAPLFAPTG